MADQTKAELQKVLAFFCRHLIGLAVTFSQRNENDEADLRTEFFSATLIIFSNQCYLLTAGHSLKDLNAAMISGQIEISSAQLVDYLGAQAVHYEPIPFDFTNAAIFYFFDKDWGLDFGLVRLDPYYVRLLGKNGVVAIERKNWEHQDEIDFDVFFMLGLPDEFSKPQPAKNDNKTTGFYEISPTLISVKRTTELPEDVKTTKFSRFIGRVGNLGELKSIKGMSGGPIIGFVHGENGEPGRYWIVAIQSMWKRSDKLIFGCPVPVLADIVETAIRDAAASTHEGACA